MPEAHLDADSARIEHRLLVISQGDAIVDPDARPVLCDGNHRILVEDIVREQADRDERGLRYLKPWCETPMRGGGLLALAKNQPCP